MQALLGTPRDRVDGPLKVTGGAKYVAEIAPPNLAHAVMVGSTIAAGHIREIDPSAALSLPGVLAVLTHENFPKLSPGPVALQFSSNRMQMKGSAGQQLLPMQDAKIEYPGQPIAVVIAESLEIATHAASLLRISYNPHTPKWDMEAERNKAYKPKNVWGDKTDNSRGNFDSAWNDAPVRLQQTYYTALQHHNTMEPHATTAHWERDQLTVFETTTWVYGARMTIGAWFDLPPEKVRVINHFVGGSFGSKGPIWPHTAICIAASKQISRPVRLVLSRPQTFIDAGYRPRIRHDVRLGAQADGKLTAFAYDTVAQTSSFDDRVVAPTTRTPPRLYACENVSTTYRLVPLNRNGPFTMRGPGEVPGLFAVESAMDELAYALNLDPIELRLRNHADEDPEHHQPWSSKHLKECYRQGAERFGWSRRDPRPGSMRDGSHLIGSGMASMMYDARSAPCKATATLERNGSIVLRTATCDQGTGSYTIMPQLAAEAMGISPDGIRLELGDTDFPMAPISAGSMTTASVGTAITQAAAELRRQIILLAATLDGSPLYRLTEDQIVLETSFCRAKSDASRRVSFTELMSRSGSGELSTRGESKPIGETQGVSRFSFGAHFAEVRINPRTCEVRVSRYVGAFAAGRIINSKTAHSQLVGGIVWGIGQALMEETNINPATGRYVNDDLGQYLVPTNADIPKINAFFIEEKDDQVNPIGVKGVGEIGTIGSAAAIANAVYHATGKRIRQLPITPDKLL